MKQKWWVISGASINEANVWNNKKTIIEFFFVIEQKQLKYETKVMSDYWCLY